MNTVLLLCGQAVIIVTFVITMVRYAGKVGQYIGTTDQLLRTLTASMEALKGELQRHIEKDDEVERRFQESNLSLSNSLASIAATLGSRGGFEIKGRP